MIPVCGCCRRTDCECVCTTDEHAFLLTENERLRAELSSLKSQPKPEPECFGEWDTTGCEIVPGDPNASHWLLRQDLPQLRPEQKCLRCGVESARHPPQVEQPKPERFDAIAAARATLEAHDDTHAVAEREGFFYCGGCLDGITEALRAAYAQGWKDAPELDNGNSRRGWERAKRAEEALREIVGPNPDGWVGAAHAKRFHNIARGYFKGEPPADAAVAAPATCARCSRQPEPGTILCEGHRENCPACGGWRGAHGVVCPVAHPEAAAKLGRELAAVTNDHEPNGGGGNVDG